jgi:solute carrier family 35 protein E3
VGFYQVMKIAVAPTVILIEAALFGKIPPVRIVASVLVVCLGIGIATVTDSQLVTNVYGLAVRLPAGRLMLMPPLRCCCWRCC